MHLVPAVYKYKKDLSVKLTILSFQNGDPAVFHYPLRNLGFIYFSFSHREKQTKTIALLAFHFPCCFSVFCHTEKGAKTLHSRKSHTSSPGTLSTKKNMMTHGPVRPSARSHRAIASSAKGRHLYTCKVGLRSQTQTTCTCAAHRERLTLQKQSKGASQYLQRRHLAHL